MSLYISHTLNRFFEAVALLKAIANNDSPTQRYENFHHKYQLPTPLLDDLFNTIVTVYDTVSTQLLGDRSLIDSYFKALTSELCDDHFFATCIIQYLLDKDLNTYLHNFKLLDQPSKLMEARLCISTLSDSLDINLSTDSEVFNCISQLDFNNDLKYRYLDLYYQFELHLEKIIPLLSKTMTYLKPYYDTLNTLFIPYLEPIFTDLGIQGITALSNYYPVSLKNDTSYFIYPCYIGNNNLSLYSTPSSSIYIFIGCHVHQLMHLIKHYDITEEALKSFTKCLSDTSKLNIINALKDQRLYASELATRLTLTNATISHHMNELARLRLVTIEKEQNKLYYSLNKERLCQYMSDLQAHLGCYLS